MIPPDTRFGFVFFAVTSIETWTTRADGDTWYVAAVESASPSPAAAAIGARAGTTSTAAATTSAAATRASRDGTVIARDSPSDGSARPRHVQTTAPAAVPI